MQQNREKYQERLIPSYKERFLHLGKNLLLRNLRRNHFNLNINACGKAQGRKSLNCFRSGFCNINKPVVRPHFELLAGMFINECLAVDREFVYFGRKGDRTRDNRAGFFSGLYNLPHRIIGDFVVKRSDLNANFLCGNGHQAKRG